MGKQVFGSSSGTLSDAPRHFLLAGISGAVAATATLPFDVVKTTVQTQGLKTTTSPALNSHKAALHARLVGTGASAITVACSHHHAWHGLLGLQGVLRAFSSA